VNIRKVDELKTEVNDYWLGFLMGVARINKKMDAIKFPSIPGIHKYVEVYLGGSYQQQGDWAIYNPGVVNALIKHGFNYIGLKPDYFFPSIDSPNEFFRGFLESRLRLNQGKSLTIGGIPTITKELVVYLNKELNVFIPIQEHKGTLSIQFSHEVMHKALEHFYSKSTSPVYDISYNGMLKFCEASPKYIWSDEEDRKLVRCYSSGKSSEKELKSVFKNVSISSIRHRAFKLNLTMPNNKEWTLSELDLLKTYAAEGIEVLQIKLLGRSKAAIQDKANGLEIEITYELPRQMTGAERLTILEMKKTGERDKYIAKHLDVTIGILSRWIEEIRESLTFEERVENELLTRKEREEYINSVIKSQP
jgi:hypothetical protein